MSAPGLSLYRAVSALMAAPAFGLALKMRARAGKEDPERLHERYGLTRTQRPNGTLIWIHAASVGESLVALAMAEDLLETLASQARPASVLITTGTRTSADLVARRAPGAVIHQFPPADAPKFVRRFLDHWRPDLAVFTESELWPNLLCETARRDIPMALANARMNKGSLKGWGRWPGTAKALLGSFDWIGAADASTAEGLAALLGRKIEQTGNLKLEADPVDPDEEALSAARAALGMRPVFVAASTHEGEEAILARAHQLILATRPDALMILVPRHPERAETIAETLNQNGLTFAQRSLDQSPDEDTPVWLADTLGEMPLWYALSPISFIGGTLIDGIGGHNPIEATRSGSAVISGPYAASFADVYAAYDDAGARAIVRDDRELAAAILTALDGGGPGLEAGLRALNTLPSGARARTRSALSVLLERRT